jgi:hypothetical protein
LPVLIADLPISKSPRMGDLGGGSGGRQFRLLTQPLGVRVVWSLIKSRCAYTYLIAYQESLKAKSSLIAQGAKKRREQKDKEESSAKHRRRENQCGSPEGRVSRDCDRQNGSSQDSGTTNHRAAAV